MALMAMKSLFEWMSITPKQLIKAIVITFLPFPNY